MGHSLLLLETQRIALMQLLLAALETSALVLLHQAVSGAEVAITVLAVSHATQWHRVALTERAASSLLAGTDLERAALGYEDEGLLSRLREGAQNAIVIDLLAIKS